MEPLYRFITKNFKIVGVFSLLVIIQFILIFSAQKEHVSYQDSLEKKPAHFQLAGALGLKLMGKCDYKASEFVTKMDKFAQAKDITYVINSEDLLKIDKLVFKQIFLLSYPNGKSDAYIKTAGFLVESLETGRCFGVI